MKVYYGQESLHKIEGGVCVALGMFDGVHIAHARLLKECAEYARERGYVSCAYTYLNQPHIAKNGTPTAMLTTLQEKIYYIGRTGINCVIVQEFNEGYASTPAREFLFKLNMLANIKAVFCGFDYRFGKNGAGSAETIESYAKEFGYKARILPAVYYGKEVVASTRIRQALAEGDIRLANGLLGRPYACGANRTAATENTAVYSLAGNKASPARGSYSCAILAGKKAYKCAADLDGRQVLIKVNENAPFTGKIYIEFLRNMHQK